MTKYDDTKRLTNLWYSFAQRAKGKRKFLKQEFISWYNNNRKKGCYYCGLSENQSKELAFKLGSKRFPDKEVKKKGSRGLNLEVDRKVPDGNYSAENCVLACYFCNNDKSDVFNHNQYMEMLHGKDWFKVTNKKNNSRYEYLSRLITVS